MAKVTSSVEDKGNFQYDLFIQKTNKNLLDEIIPDAYIEMQAENSADVVSEPIEEGGFTSFYKTHEPVKVNVTLSFSTDDVKQQKALDLLYKRQKEYDLITFATPTQIFQNLTIVNINYSRTSSENMSMLTVQLELQEVKSVKVVLGKSTASFTPKKPTSQKKTETGKKQAIEKEVEAKVRKSLVGSGLGTD